MTEMSRQDRSVLEPHLRRQERSGLRMHIWIATLGHKVIRMGPDRANFLSD